MFICKPFFSPPTLASGKIVCSMPLEIHDRSRGLINRELEIASLYVRQLFFIGSAVKTQHTMQMERERNTYIRS